MKSWRQYLALFASLHFACSGYYIAPGFSKSLTPVPTDQISSPHTFSGDVIKFPALRPVPASPAIRLNSSFSSGIFFGVDGVYSAARRLNSGRLLKINGVPLKGKSLIEVQDLLYGEQGSKVELTVIDHSGDIGTEIFERVAYKNSHVPEISQSRYWYRHLEDSSSVLWDNENRNVGSDMMSHSTDLFVRAQNARFLKRWASFTPPKVQSGKFTLTENIYAGDTIGDLKASDMYIDEVLNLPPNLSRIDWSAHAGLSGLVVELINTNRIGKAEQICKIVLPEVSAKDLGSDHQMNQCRTGFRRLYAQSLLGQSAPTEYCISPSYSKERAHLELDNSALKAVLTELEKGGFVENNYQLNVSYSNNWIGNAYEAAGDYEKALSCFEKLKPLESPVFKQTKDEIRFETICPAIYSGIRLAQLQEVNGIHKAAVDTMKRLNDLFNEKLSEDKQNVVEMFPCFYPVGSDIEIELAKIYANQGETDLAKIELAKAKSRLVKALGVNAPQLAVLDQILSVDPKVRVESANKLAQMSQPDMRLVSGSEITLERMKIVQDAYRAIRVNDLAASRIAISQLLFAYSQELPGRGYPKRLLDYFSVLSGIVRELASGERYKESLAILDFLDMTAKSREYNDVLPRFTEVDRALIKSMQGSNNSPWAVVDDQCCLVPEDDSFNRYPYGKVDAETLKVVRMTENMRRLAALYATAGYARQADILLRRALELHNESPEIKANAQQLDVLETAIMLGLEEACFRAREGRYPESEKLALNAVAQITPEVVADKQHTAKEYNEAFVYKTIQLAEILDANKQFDTGIKVLEKLRGKIEPSGFSSEDQPLDSEGIVDWFKLKQWSIVNAYIAKFQLAMGNSLIAEKTISKAIKQAGNNVPYQYYEIGIESATKTGNDDFCAHLCSEASRGVNFSLSSVHGNAETDLSQRLLKRAMVLAEHSKTFPKDELVDMYIRLAGYNDCWTTHSEHDNVEKLVLYKKASELIPDSSPRKVDLLNKIVQIQTYMTAATGKLTTVSKEQNYKEDEISKARTNFPIVLKAATLAEESKSPTAGAKWMQVASSEALFGEFDKAIEHAKHGIALYKNNGEQTLNVRTPVDDGKVVYLLNQAGHKKEAQSLYLMAIDKVKLEYGPHSLAAASIVAKYFSFMVADKNDKEAMVVLSELLGFGARTLELSAQSPIDLICHAAACAQKEGRGELAIRILAEVLKMQKKELPQDDRRFAETLGKTGDIYAAMGRNSEAEQSYRAAIDILQFYSGKERAEGLFRGQLVPVLVALGKKTEAERLNATKVRPMPFSSLYNDSFDGRFDKDISALYRKWVNSPDLDEMKAELAAARAQAPYSTRTKMILITILQYAEKKKDYSLIAEVSDQLIQVDMRNRDKVAGRQTGCVPPDYYRYSFYGTAVDANLKLGRKEKAFAYAKEAFKVLPELHIYELIQIAEWYERCGHHAEALKMAELTRSRHSNSDYYTYSRTSNLWQLLGDSKKAAADRAEYARLRALSDENYRKNEKDPLRGLQPSGY